MIKELHKNPSLLKAFDKTAPKNEKKAKLNTLINTIKAKATGNKDTKDSLNSYEVIAEILKELNKDQAQLAKDFIRADKRKRDAVKIPKSFHNPFKAPKEYKGRVAKK